MSQEFRRKLVHTLVVDDEPLALGRPMVDGLRQRRDDALPAFVVAQLSPPARLLPNMDADIRVVADGWRKALKVAAPSRPDGIGGANSPRGIKDNDRRKIRR